MADDDGPRPAAFCYLHVCTPYGPGGGPGSLADYANAAARLGYPALACSDYGSVAAWPDWERACRRAGIRPIYGLTFDLCLDPADADPWPVLALAATGTGLRHLVGIHNRLERTPTGRCTFPLAALPDLAAGLWLILLPTGEYGPAPLTNLARPAALATLDHLLAHLPRPEQVLCGLPPDETDQLYLAELAAEAGLPVVALPAVRYPIPAHAPIHAILRAFQQGGPDKGPADPTQALNPFQDRQLALERGDGAKAQTLVAPEQVAEDYVPQTDALALAGAVAASCRASLADLPGPAGLVQEGADAALDAAVDEALAAAGRARDPQIDAELAALHRQGWAGPLLAARRIVAAARARGLVLGVPGGIAGEGRVQALLGLAPTDPFGAPPRWLDTPPQAAAWQPAITVAALRRDTLLGALHETGTTPGRAAPAPVLVPAGGHHARGPAQALAVVAHALNLPTATAATLGQALVAGRVSERAVRWRAAATDLPPATADQLLSWVTALESLPGPPLVDGETLLVLPPTHELPLLPLPGAPGRRVAAWSAADCLALGAHVLLLRGDSALDPLQRALELAGDLPAGVPTDTMRLLLASGDLAGLPLPLAGGALDDLATTPDVLAALCSGLLPDDPADAPGWAALGALLYGPPSPHPHLRTYLRRRVGAAPVPAYNPALAPVLAPTWGLVLYAEQVTILRLLLRQEGVIPPGESLRLEEWIGQAATWTSPYAAALAAGERLHLALRLKVEQPAAFLAAALESAVLDGDTATGHALILEARRRGVELRPPDLQISAAGFILEDGALRWGLAWSRATVPPAAALVAARAQAPEGRFASLAALCTAAVEAAVPASTLATLIRAGACDSLGTRTDLLAALPVALEQAALAHAARQPVAATAQPTLFDALTTAPVTDILPAESAGLANPEPEVQPPGVPAAETDPKRAVDRGDESAIPNPKSTYRTWEAALAGYSFSPPSGAEALARAPGTNGAIARLTLGGIAAKHIGQTVSVTAVLSDLHVVPAGGNANSPESMAVALAQDGTGALPLVLFPSSYTRYKAQLQPEIPLILTARVQRAEAWEGSGAQVVLIGEQVLLYQVERAEPELDLTVRKRRETATAGAPRKAKPEADPTQYSATGQRYFTAPRPAGEAAPGDGAAPGAASPAGAPAANQVVITLHPLADEQADETRMRRLKEILARHPGPTPVLLYFPDDPSIGMPTYMPVKRTVDASDAFCAEVTELLGAGCYELRASG